MNKSDSDKNSSEPLPKHIDDMPERQREAMQETIKKSEFDGKEHLEKSPVGRAVARSSPLKRR